MVWTGARHAALKTCGFTTALWEELGESWVASVTGLDMMSTNKEACRSWRMLVAALVEHMREGYVRACLEYAQLAHHVVNDNYLRVSYSNPCVHSLVQSGGQTGASSRA